MAEAPINLVLVQLREIRAKQDEHSAEFVEVRKELASLRTEVEDLALGTNQAVGLATRALNRGIEQSTHVTSVERELRDLKARVAALEAASA